MLIQLRAYDAVYPLLEFHSQELSRGRFNILVVLSSSNDSNNRKRIMKTIKSWFSKITKGAMAQTAALVIIPVSCSMVFAACSNLADTAQNQPATTGRAYIEQTQEQPGDADPEPYEWFY